MGNGPICDNGGCALQMYTCPDGKHKLNCVPPGIDCLSPVFVDGPCTDVHDDVLRQATEELNDVIKNIPHDSEGRYLAFIRVDVGLRLAWVYHNAAPADGVLITDPAEKNAVLGVQS
jgi:hypothetical protein